MQVTSQRAVVAVYLVLAFALPVSAAPRERVIALDPSDRLAAATSVLVAPAGANGPWVWTATDSGPDLDLGFNDFLQFRLSVPQRVSGQVRVLYATSTRPGFATERSITIPEPGLIRDGKPHAYRLDLGLEVHWRDELRGLRVEVPAGAHVEYAEVGDLPNDVLLVNEDLNIFVGDDRHKPETRADLSKLESKHFVYWWSPMSSVSDPGFDPKVMPRRALRMSEECYQVYCKLARYIEPFENGEVAKRDGKRYKVNITSWYGGTWMGGQNGWTYYNIPGWGLRDEGWGNPVPHECAHAIQGMQPGFLNGAFWESHANYLRELRNRHYRDLMPGYQTTLERGALSQSCVLQDHQRFIYADFRIYLALDEIASELGLGPYPATRLWTDGPKEMTAWGKLARLLPKGKSVKDVACMGLRRFALLDFADGAAYRAALRKVGRDAASFDLAMGSGLIPCADRPGWWLVPIGRAPMRYGYMTHELTPDRTGKVAVEVRGLDTVGKGEDWRWSLVASGPTTKPRYSPVWPPGARTFALRKGETRLHLVVVATPDVLDITPAGFQDRHPLDRHPGFLRYPYEVRLVGATPTRGSYEWARPVGQRHPNGGGFVADTATVEATAYVARDARVLDRAKVLGRAKVRGRAVVLDDAVLQDRAVAADAAWIGGSSVMRDDSRASGRSRLQGRSVVREHARAQGHCVLTNVELSGHAIARGNATPWDCKVSGHAILDFDYSMAFNVTDGVQFNHVPWGGWFGPYWAETQRKPRALIASYRMDQPDGEMCWDEFGSMPAYLRGAPTAYRDTAHGGRALRLDGKGQWIALDGALCDASALTFGLWVKPDGVKADLPLVVMGRSDGPVLRVTTRNADGRAACIVRSGGSVQTVRASRPMGRGWSHLAVTLSGSKLSLYLNGLEVGSVACAVGPTDLLAPGDGSSAPLNLIGRDAQGRLFAGSIADVRFYCDAMGVEEIRAEMARRGDLRYVGLMAGVALDGKTAIETGIRNGIQRTLSAWVKPDPSASGDATLPVIDSRDERDGALHGAGIGLRGGQIVARLDGVGDWETGVILPPGDLAHVALAFDGTSATLFVNAKRAAEKTYRADPERLSPKCYRIGCAQPTEAPDSRTYFTGSIRDVRIYDRKLMPEELARMSRQTDTRSR